MACTELTATLDDYVDGLMQPALALSAPSVAGAGGDGLITMSEVLGLRLDADWVVLSACNTAAADGAGAEAVSGLGRAFFYAGTRAVLEVRSHEVPFVLEDGQVVGRLIYERLMDVPDKLYGRGIGSSYQKQALALSKHFVAD